MQKSFLNTLSIVMAKLAITISSQGIQTLSFFGNTEAERRKGLKLYMILEEELRVIDRLIKQHFVETDGESEMKGKVGARTNGH